MRFNSRCIIEDFIWDSIEKNEIQNISDYLAVRDWNDPLSGIIIVITFPSNFIKIGKEIGHGSFCKVYDGKNFFFSKTTIKNKKIKKNSK